MMLSFHDLGGKMMTKDVMEKIREHLRFIRIREYATLVICGDLSKESAVKHLRMPLEEFESWLGTWRFIQNCLDEGEEENSEIGRLS